MSDDDLRAVIKKLAEYYVQREVTGRAFAWTVESLIATSAIDERDERMATAAEFLAAYSPSGGEGLHDEKELMRFASSLLE
ncbi:MAG: hypothetical protein JO197_07075 [Acidobacteria bacterium]|nr:hypothetical protein [Acidobacteriota bacterium]MBV9477616.1 hypothetical protein [Acidobacteriota bacterium]